MLQLKLSWNQGKHPGTSLRCSWGQGTIDYSRWVGLGGKGMPQYSSRDHPAVAPTVIQFPLYGHRGPRLSEGQQPIRASSRWLPNFEHENRDDAAHTVHHSHIIGRVSRRA